LFIAAIYFFILGLEGDNMLYLLISPLILGIATLTKSIVLFFPIIISILIYCYNRYRLRKKIFFILEYLMIFLITLSPWAYRNYENYGYFKLDTMGEDLLLSWNATLTEVIRTNQPLTESSFVAIRHKFGREVEQNVKNKSSNPFYISEVQKKIAFRYIKDNFRDFIKCHLKGIGNIYIGIGGVGTSDIFSILRLRHIKLPEDSLTSVFRRIKFALQSWPFYMLILSALIYGYLCIIYVIFLIGFYLLLRRKQYFFFFMVLLAVIYFSIPVGIIGNYRYKLPLVPFFSLLGATAIRTIVCVIKRQYST
jgi:4-amino-4-deoxy-L-arabinose transferase-like glycosyltransferase